MRLLIAVISEPNHRLSFGFLQGHSTAQASSSPSVQPAQPPSDKSFTSIACPPFDNLLAAPLPAASSIGDHHRPSAKVPHPNEVLKCPRCQSPDTKFCYYNNYSLTQPRYFCKNCKRYWTAGGALRNVPVGGGLRKNKRSKLKLAAAADAEAARASQQASRINLQPQSDQAQLVAEASQMSDNRISPLPAASAIAQHVIIGVPQLYANPSGDMKYQAAENFSSSASHNVVHQNGEHAAAAMVPATAGDFYAKEEASAGVGFLCDPNQAPHFYPNYAASVSMPFATSIVPSGSMPGYSVNYNYFSADPNISTDKCGNSTALKMGSIGAAAMDSSAGEVKQGKDAAQGSVSTYDWQLVSDDGNFLYTPSSSWPDFSHFNDTGPG